MTAGLEKEMDEIAAGNKNLEGVVSDSVKKLHEVIDTLLEHRSELALEIKKSISTNNVIGKCNKCESGDLISRKGKSGKRFVGCNSYPACTNSFPLPQKGTIITTKELCAVCGVPVIRVKNKGREYKMCIDMNCKTKDSWRKKASIVKTKKK